jgi:hypothetical protein
LNGFHDFGKEEPTESRNLTLIGSESLLVLKGAGRIDFDFRLKSFQRVFLVNWEKPEVETMCTALCGRGTWWGFFRKAA